MRHKNVPKNWQSWTAEYLHADHSTVVGPNMQNCPAAGEVYACIPIVRNGLKCLKL